MRGRFSTALLLLIAAVPVSCISRAPADSLPNIIVIEIDDLGYGDLGAYNPEIDFTPAIDRLAEQGLRLTDYHSNGPMCSPTRAAFLTGMYQHRLPDRFETALSAERRDPGMPIGTVTIADVLGEAGYATGKLGKWHLGYENPYVPTNYGFDEFRGLLSGDGDHHTHVNRWGVEDWWHDNRLNMVEGYSVDLITEGAVDFIERHRETPFFLYVSHLAIHFPWQGPNDPPYREAGKSYGDDKWGIIPDERNVRPHVRSMLISVDTSVEMIVRTLEKLDLDENTLVIVTSDNGGYVSYDGRFHNISSNGLLRGQKGQVYEGGHRVPFIAYWPGRIESGRMSDLTAMTMDLFPTFAELAGADVPAGKVVDGVSILPTLQGQAQPLDRAVFWRIRDSWAARRGPWKLSSTGGEISLFNLDDDVGETRNLAGEHAGITEELAKSYDSWARSMQESRLAVNQTQ